MTVKLIAAVSRNGVLGQDQKIPWNYPEDMKFFRDMTKGGTVILGRRTFESIGKPLPKRRNIVITRSKLDVEGVETFETLQQALDACPPDQSAAMRFISSAAQEQYKQEHTVWLIGGANIYREGMQHANELFITCIPQTITGDGLVYFPWLDPMQFRLEKFIPLDAERNELAHVAHYVRRNHMRSEDFDFIPKQDI